MIGYRHLRGMGASEGQTIASGSTQVGGAVASFLVPAAAIPIVGLAVAGVGLAIAAIFARKGPQQKVKSTSIVNDLEPQLKANVTAYMNGPRTVSSQRAALANFDAAWNYLKSSNGCGSPDLGNPGIACIADRSRSGRWPWEVYYRDPIANDPGVLPDPLPAQQVADLVTAEAAAAGIPTTVGGVNVSTILLFGAGALLVSQL
jgi:hypothetical protein